MHEFGTAHGTLYPAYYTLHTAHCTLHTVHCTLHIAHCTLHITPPNPPLAQVRPYSPQPGAVWPTVIQAQLGPHIVTLCTGTASQQWLIGGGVSLGISF